MADKKPQRLLPALRYSPRQDGGRGGGDYMYMNRGNGYASNPEYAAKFGGGGGAPPAQPPPLLSPPTDQPPVPPTMGPGVGAMDWNLVNETRSTAGLPAFDSQSGSFPSGMGQPNIPQNQYGWMQQAAPDPTGTGGTQGGNWLQNLDSGIYQGARNAASQFNNWLQDTDRAIYQAARGQGGGVTGAPNPNGAQATTPTGAGGTTGGSVKYNPAGDTRQEAIQDSRDPSVPSVQEARTADAVTKNQNLTDQAKAAGDEKELARLQAEWDRIAPMAQKFGITPERLVNSYMQPGNDAAETDMSRAMGKALQDDAWAGAATVAFGRPPNQLEWDEHWYAMNKGGKDPLEGHPAAIQEIQRRMEEIRNESVNTGYALHQQWMAGQQ
jgi:hypothetical protein